MWPYPIAIEPTQPFGRGRRCAFWVSAFVPPNTRYLLDTAALTADERMFAGRDSFPDDCLLVVVSPADEYKLRQQLETAPFPAAPVCLLVPLIDGMCQQSPTLAAATRWFDEDDSLPPVDGTTVLD